MRKKIFVIGLIVIFVFCMSSLFTACRIVPEKSPSPNVDKVAESDTDKTDGIEDGEKDKTDGENEDGIEDGEKDKTDGENEDGSDPETGGDTGDPETDEKPTKVKWDDTIYKYGIESADLDIKNADGQLVVVTNAYFEPFEYLISKNFSGIDMEIAKYMADKFGMELVIIDTDFDVMMPLMEKQWTDICIAGLTNAEHRKQFADFTDSYYDASLCLVVKSDDTTFDQCSAKADVDAVLSVGNMTGGYVDGRYAMYYLQGSKDFEFDGFSNVISKGYQDYGSAVSDLLDGKSDFIIDDMSVAKMLVANADGKIKIVNVCLTEDIYVIAVDKNQPELLSKINALIAEMQADGTLQKIFELYYQVDGEDVSGI